MQQGRIKRGWIIFKLSARIAIYIVVFLLCWIFEAVLRLIQAQNRSFRNDGLYYVHVIASVSTTFWVAIAFIYCEDIFGVYSKLLCRKKQKELKEPLMNEQESLAEE